MRTHLSTSALPSALLPLRRRRVLLLLLRLLLTLDLLPRKTRELVLDPEVRKLLALLVLARKEALLGRGFLGVRLGLCE